MSKTISFCGNPNIFESQQLKQRSSVLLTLVFSLFFLTGLKLANAEPWLSNRFAQNCAGCHAPGRLNRMPKERRCTLSCQGCHVNPNGGGLRSYYGKWNSERWLRSFYSETAWSKPTPAPVTEQKYYYANMANKLKEKIQSNPEFVEGKVKNGIPVKTTNEAVFDETHYDRRTENEHTIAASQLEDLFVIPADDPYRLERENYFTVGSDFRFFYWNNNSEGVPDNQKSVFFPMSIDAGFRVRPIKENLSFVYETRGFGSPNGKLESMFASSVQTRSAYVLVDDLPYNTYAQAGIYRPMFGYYTADHTSLINTISGLNQYAVFKTAGFGAAPNVPFGVVNMIFGTDVPGIQNQSGFVVTGGLRFVKLGGSITASYWNTKMENAAGAGATKTQTMVDINGGIQLGKMTFNWDWMRVEKSKIAATGPDAIDAGDVLTAELRYQLWKQFYPFVMYSTANTAVDLSAGSASDMAIGATAFILSGMEMSLLYSNKSYTASGNTTKANLLLSQLHFYF